MSANINLSPAIKEAIQNKKLVFFIGSGFSKSLGFPDWKGLIELVFKKLKDDYPKESVVFDYLEQKFIKGENTEINTFDELSKENYKADIIKLIAPLFGRTDFEEGDLVNFKLLWQISSKIITTNYDFAIEKAHPNDIKSTSYADEFWSNSLYNEDSYLYKAHGCISRPAECVLFSEEYNKIYDKQSGTWHTMMQALSQNTIVFLGFSLNDPDINELLELRKNAFKGFRPKAFIINTKSEARYKDLDVVHVPILNYNEGLNNLLEEWAKYAQDPERSFERHLAHLIKEGKVNNPISEEQKQRLRDNFNNLIETEYIKINSLLDNGKYKEAEEKLLNDYYHQEKETAYKAFKLANFYELTLDFKKAETFYKKAFESDPDNLDFSLQYGMCLTLSAKYNEALKIYNTAIEKTDNNPTFKSIFLNNIGSCLKELGKINEAIKHHQESIVIQERFFGKNCINTSDNYDNIGLCYHAIGNYDLAIENLYKSLSLRLKTYGDNHPKTSNSYNNIGITLNALGKHEEALTYFFKDLAFQLNEYGENHPSTGASYNSLGMVNTYLKNYNIAIDFFKKDLKIILNTFGEKHPDTATNYYNTGLAYSSLGDYQKAVTYYNKSYLLFKNIFGEAHYLTIQAKDALELTKKIAPSNRGFND